MLGNIWRTEYCEAQFFRSQGLGNRLFPWARCRIFSWSNNIEMLAPHWCLLRIGPLRRRQMRLRSFRRQSMLCGQLKPSPDMVTGPKRALIRRKAIVVPEPRRLDRYDRGPPRSGPIIVRFSGVEEAFSPLMGWESPLREGLLASMRDHERQLGARTVGSTIGVHVRRGDFVAVSETELASWHGPVGALRTPMSWFVKSVSLVREILGHAAPAFVVSDGDLDELRPLLRLGGVTLLRGGSPISDMIALSNARILIGSMQSSFTAWASFLGQMTTCTFPAPTGRFLFVNQNGRYTGALDPETPPRGLLDDLEHLET